MPFCLIGLSAIHWLQCNLFTFIRTDQHPVIGGKNASSEPAIVEALIESALLESPLLRPLSLLLLHVKAKFLGLLWEGSMKAETMLKNMADLEDRVTEIFKELHLEFEIIQVGFCVSRKRTGFVDVPVRWSIK